MRLVGLGLALVGAGTAIAQEPPSPRVIQVTGFGIVATMPDMAVIDYWVTGEGKTPDEATSALVARQKAILAGINGLLQGSARVTNNSLSVIAVRGTDCRDVNNYNPQPRLDQGPCAVVGYLATIQGAIRTPQIDKAGTAIGLASQLGARDARLQMFQLTDRQSANSAAMERAIADAKRQAAAIAHAAGEKLGPIVMVRDQNFQPAEDIGIIPLRAPAPPPPPAPRAPIEIGISPQPIETRAQVYVSFAIAP